MRTIKRDKTVAHHKVHYNTVRAAIKKDPMLSKYLGRWNASSRVSGWGRYIGYIQVDNKLVDVKVDQQPTYTAGDYRISKATIHNYYTAEIRLLCEQDHAKNGWTEEHTRAIRLLAERLGVSLEIKN